MTTTTTSRTFLASPPVKKYAHHVPNIIWNCSNGALREEALKVFEDHDTTKEVRDKMALKCNTYEDKKVQEFAFHKNNQRHEQTDSYVLRNMDFYNIC